MYLGKKFISDNKCLLRIHLWFYINSQKCDLGQNNHTPIDFTQVPKQGHVFKCMCV